MDRQVGKPEKASSAESFDEMHSSRDRADAQLKRPCRFTAEEAMLMHGSRGHAAMTERVMPFTKGRMAASALPPCPGCFAPPAAFATTPIQSCGN